ncbi:MAG: 4a-hydroxytetrahydrobiopterin dehydratase [Hydrogenovibrio sp.]|uniref:4a-hydroxytetrahydrobiopterin dehydratase n=1 Tax=Hydrogenovibrio TaxID=28884 RepID=UPI0003630734|nr:MULTISPECIES: 4a-hydroxytetrahydrobiopterin dehydratase [Hydrogenovibrio]MDR9499862.1 4a-hydroxytetrahydrobiopterin dehydratase [Hydrogenovibrio sp.]
MTRSEISPWKVKQRPASMEAKFVFDSYDDLRAFLDEVAEQAEALSHHPNVSFGRDYASLVIYSEESELTDVDYQLADRIDAGFQKVKQA